VKLRTNFVLFLLVTAACTFAQAADLAILRNGNSIRHERREVLGTVTRLYLSDVGSGYIEIPTDQIERFEHDYDPPATSPLPKTEFVRTQQPASASVQLNPQVEAKIDQQTLNIMVNGASQRHQIDPDFINSVIRAESGFNNRAVSKKGAQGLMQLMPGTASQLGVKNSFDPNANVEGGTKYLRELLEKYDYDVPKALAAYNAGAGRVDKYHGVPPYSETQAYVARIIRDYNKKKLAENPSLAHKAKATSAKSAKPKTPTKAATKKAFPHGPESASAK
jgi:hypothetical protein